MNFLPNVLPGDRVMLLTTYYSPGEYNQNDDILDIVYKNIDTKKTYVETIRHPTIDIFIVKPEYRTYDHYKSWIEKEKCDCYRMSYKNRYAEIAKILQCPVKEAKYSKYIFQADLDIEHFYMMEFQRVYAKEGINPVISYGFADIETDIINHDGFPDPGTAPINAISFFHNDEKTMHTFVCIQDNIPDVPESHKNYERNQILKKKFKERTEYFVDHLDEFVKECEDSFKESYGDDIIYKVYSFDDELYMLKAFWNFVHSVELDFLEFWNAPFDVSNLVERLKTLGEDPNEIIPNREMKGRRVYWKEDRNYEVAKRKHVFNTYTKFIVGDQMVIYAGVRSGRGKLPSVKLNFIGQRELKDEKLDYSEYGNIRLFPYMDFWKFIKYNIKDVLLQSGIEWKTRDLSYVYTLMSSSCIKFGEIFTSTTLVSNDIRVFGYNNENMLLGTNKNKLLAQPMTEEEAKEHKKRKEKDKFAGAFVMNPAHCQSTGFKILGKDNKYFHEHSADEDITSEYPTAMLVANISTETMVGKVFLEAPMEVPMYDNMWIVDSKDETIYNRTANASNLLVEGLSEDNPLAFGQLYLHLPSMDEIFEDVEEHLEELVK